MLMLELLAVGVLAVGIAGSGQVVSCLVEVVFEGGVVDRVVGPVRFGPGAGVLLALPSQERLEVGGPIERVLRCQPDVLVAHRRRGRC